MSAGLAALVWSVPATALTWLAQVQLWALPVWSVGVLLFSVRLVWGCAHAFALGRAGIIALE